MTGYNCDLCGKWIDYPSDHNWMCARYKPPSGV